MSALHRLLSRRLLYGESTDKHRLLPIIRIASIGVGVGVAFILLSLFIVSGFKYEIREKINGFSGNLRIFHPENTYGQYTTPLEVSDELEKHLEEALQAKWREAFLSPFVEQMALLKSDSAYVGLQLHGVGRGYDRAFYRPYLVQGSLPSFGTGNGAIPLLLSQKNADLLGLSPGDDILAYFFVNGQTKVRKLILSGTFRTGYKDYDESYALTDITCLQGVNGWQANEYGGIEVRLPSYHLTTQAYDTLYPLLWADTRSGSSYTMYTARDMSPVMFGWVDLLDTNVQLILILVICIAATIMITGIIVVILQKAHAIAILKSLGMRTRALRRTFRRLSLAIVLRGLLWGNALALVLGLLQHHTHWLRLDPAQYYMDAVPVRIEWQSLLGVNALTLIVLYLLMYVPTRIIAEIEPVKILRFD